jgi:hypothetical protein
MTIGVRAAPTVHEVTGQKEFGKCASEMPNLSLIACGALVITAALKPTMKQLRRCQLGRTAEGNTMVALECSWRGVVLKGESKGFENALNANIASGSALPLSGPSVSKETWSRPSQVLHRRGRKPTAARPTSVGFESDTNSHVASYQCHHPFGLDRPVEA